MARDSGFGRVVSELTKVVGELSRAVSSIGKAATAPSSPAKATSTTSTVTALGAVAGAAAAVSAALLAVPFAVTKFVAAFNPGAVELLSATLEQLAATIGYALEPIVQGTVEVLRAVTGELAVFAMALRPVVTELVSTLVPVIKLLAAATADYAQLFLSVVVPIVRVLATVLDGVATIANVVLTTFGSLVGALLEMVGISFSTNSVLDTLRAAFVGFATFMVRLTDTFLRLIGATDLADRILRNLGGRRPQDVIKAAPKDIGIAGLQDIYRQRLEAAAKGMTGPSAQERTNSILEQIQQTARELLEESRRNPSLPQRAAQGIADQFDSWVPPGTRTHRLLERVGRAGARLVGMEGA